MRRSGESVNPPPDEPVYGSPHLSDHHCTSNERSAFKLGSKVYNQGIGFNTASNFKGKVERCVHYDVLQIFSFDLRSQGKLLPIVEFADPYQVPSGLDEAHASEKPERIFRAVYEGDFLHDQAMPIAGQSSP
jgi:hypothetical protein